MYKTQFCNKVPRLNNIVKACIKGDCNAQTQLYKLFAGTLYAVCLRYASNNDDARDILQEGFIKIFDKLHQYKNKGSLEGWMRKVVVNTALERIRRGHRFVLIDDYNQMENEHFQYEHILAHIQEQELLGMIQELSPQYRMVFNLYAIEGYAHHEISSKLHISEGTSKSNLFRARELLKAKIESRYQVEIERVI